MKKILLFGCLLPIVLLVGYAVGLFTMAKDIPPTTWVRDAYKAWFWDAWDRLYPDYEAVNPEALRTNVRTIVQISSAADVARKRTGLVNFVWAETQHHLAALLPSEINTNASARFLAPIQSLSRITKFKVELDYGLSSTGYLLRPKQTNGELVVLQEGHYGRFPDCKACMHENWENLVERLLSAGYTVGILWLPWMGPNGDIAKLPWVNTRLGVFQLTNFGRIKYLTSPTFTSLKILLDPIYATINYVTREEDYSCIHMIGISFGATITSLYAAIDDRICKSYAVDGHPPVYVGVHHPGHEASFEDDYHLREIANTLELYVMAGYGRDRRHVQILNRYWTGSWMDAYRADLEQVANSLGEGGYKGVFDESDRHWISDRMIEFIERDMAN